MKKSLVLIICGFLTLNLCAQLTPYRFHSEDPSIPNWVKMMYASNPVVQDVVSEYDAYYRLHDFEPTIYTHQYRQWLSSAAARQNNDGMVLQKSASQRAELEREWAQKAEGDRSDDWSFFGPKVHYWEDQTQASQHSNVYCHDRSLTNPSLLFCGTESGGLYKSVDQGANWEFVTKGMLIGSVNAVRIHPTNPDIVLFGAENDIYRSEDGGTTWQVSGQQSFVDLYITVWEIAYHPTDDNIVFAATNAGLFRSIDIGLTWTQIMENECQSMAFKPGSPATMYAGQLVPSLNIYKCYKSEDNGLTFTLYDDGWYEAPAGEEGLMDVPGIRLATTEADPERVYAVIVGYTTSGTSVTTNGWIGTWVSYDAGLTWSFPHGMIGTPYTAEHPNLMNFSADDGTYTQILYNTTLAASQLDPDKILIGGLNLWRSNDAGATYTAMAGYIGYVSGIHVDEQELRIYKTSDTTEEVWLSNDGGIHHSTDFLESHQSLCRGIMAVNFWGYDQGWNDDIAVGGRYHNGNCGYVEGYPYGEFRALGGGEAASGYVNYSDERRTYFSDIGGVILPESIDGATQGIGLGMSPNESYYVNSSSRLFFDQNYFNVAYLGRDNIIYKSMDGGSSFTPLHTFGTSGNLLWMEQSRANPDFFYVHQGVGNSSKLWQSQDHGETWTQLNLPSTARNLVFTLSSDNENEVWVGYYYTSNGNKVYHTTNAGVNWDNITTNQLDNLQVWAIAAQHGTDGGVYIGTLNGSVFYRNNSMTQWATYGSGLPLSMQPLRLVPSYRTGKIRMCSWNVGIWEAPFYEASSLQADFSVANNEFTCPGEEILLNDHSVVGTNATYSWSMPGASPSASAEQNPVVSYSNPGTYDITLTVTEGLQSATITKTAFISSLSAEALPLIEDFESAGFAEHWKFNHANNTNSYNWQISSEASGYGVGAYCMYFENFYWQLNNQRDEVWTPKLDFANYGNAELTFDVAYAQFGFPYSDTLAVLVSSDCGNTFTEVFMKGGTDLATAPDNGNAYTPTSSEWRTESIDLSNFAGEPEVIVAFQNRNQFGNRVFVDNINIAGSGVDVTEQIFGNGPLIYPNPSTSSIQISTRLEETGSCRLSVFDATGRCVKQELIFVSKGQLQKRLDMSDLSIGLYTLDITTGNSHQVAHFEILR